MGLAIRGWYGLAVGGIVWFGFRLLMRVHPWPPSQMGMGTIVQQSRADGPKPMISDWPGGRPPPDETAG